MKNWCWIKRLWVHCNSAASFALPQHSPPEGTLLPQSPRKQVTGKHSSFISQTRQQGHWANAWFPCKHTEIQWLARSSTYIFRLQPSLLKHQPFLSPGYKAQLLRISSQPVQPPSQHYKPRLPEQFSKPISEGPCREAQALGYRHYCLNTREISQIGTILLSFASSLC